MCAIQLLPAQEPIAEQIIRNMTGANESVALIPGAGPGKTRILLAALTRITLTRSANDHEAVLIATPGLLIEEWTKHIYDIVPEAAVWVFDSRNDRFNLSAPGRVHTSRTLNVMAAATPEEWKRRDPRPAFFLTNFHSVRRLALTFDNWFDRAVEDENFPNVNMDKIRVDLRHVGKNFVRIHLGLQ